MFGFGYRYCLYCRTPIFSGEHLCSLRASNEAHDMFFKITAAIAQQVAESKE